MCGIFGYIGNRDAVEILLDGLRRLEYRGYDSAGLVIQTPSGLEVRRSAGRIDRLDRLVAAEPLSGSVGLGHTRWATHGRPADHNAHPHRDCSGLRPANAACHGLRTLAAPRPCLCRKRRPALVPSGHRLGR